MTGQPQSEDISGEQVTVAASTPKVALPESAPLPSASAAEVDSLRKELAGLRAELRAIKDAPAAEERRRNMQELLAADFAWRRRTPGTGY